MTGTSSYRRELVEVSDSQPAQGQLFTTAEDIRTESRERTKTEVFKSIPKGDPVPAGWAVRPTKYKHVERIVKPLSRWKLFENRVWRLFYELGMQQLNSGSFALRLKARRDPKSGQVVHKTKQVDVLAVHDNTVFLVECKTAETLRAKSLKAEVAEFASNRNDFMKALTELLGFKPRLVMVLATLGIELAFNDVEDAKEAGIRVWSDGDVRALEELSGLAGEGARYQLYNMVFQGQRVKDMGIEVPALKAKMGGHVYYSFVMHPEDLLEIAYVHHRVGSSSFRDLTDSYQRMLNPGRIRKIRRFIEDGGFFPGSIILNFDAPLQENALVSKERAEHLRKGGVPVVLTLPAEYGSAWIIDGQHRLYGYAGTEEKSSETIAVVAFVKEDPSFQSRVFVDINEKQQAVSTNLLWDLYEDLYKESNEPKEMRKRTISRIAKALNAERGGPFCGLIAVPKEGNEGIFGFRSVCYPIEQNGLAVEDTEQFFHVDYEQTVPYATERISAFYDVLRKAMPGEWAMGDKHFICTPTGFLILTGILSDLVSENMSAKTRNDLVAFRAETNEKLKPLIDHLLGAKKSVIDGYRGGGGAEKQAAEVREILTDAMKINSNWLNKRRRRRESETRQVLLKDTEAYLTQPESTTLELKGSLLLDVGRYLKLGEVDRKSKEIRNSALKTIVAFLNTRGGDLLLGVLEALRFDGHQSEALSKCVKVGDRLVCGIDLDLDGQDFDWYTRALFDLVKQHVGTLPIDRKLIDIEELTAYKGLRTCVVRVEPSPRKQFLDGDFYVRRGPATDKLTAAEVEDFWESRTYCSRD
jgi:DNA sulfur modification protein DndB